MAVAAAASDSPRLSLADAALALGTGGAFAAVLQAQGGYEVRGWGLLGLGLVALVVLQLAAGRRPSRPVVAAGAALVALGAWSALSALRGGITGEAFSYGDRLVVAAAALLVGSMLARGGREARFAVVGVVGAAAAIAAEVLVVLPFAPRHGGWLLDGILIGPVGYKNAQGAVFAIAIPLAVLLAQAAGRTARAAAVFAAVLLLGGLFLTESRGALGALVLALVAQMLLDRRTGVLRAVLVLSVAGAALFGTLALRQRAADLAPGSRSRRSTRSSRSRPRSWPPPPRSRTPPGRPRGGLSRS